MIKRTPSWYLKFVIVYGVYGVLSALLYSLGINVTSIFIEIVWVLFNIYVFFGFSNKTKKYEQAAVILPVFFAIMFVFSAFMRTANIKMAIINTVVLSFLEMFLAIYLWIGKRKLVGKPEEELEDIQIKRFGAKKHSFGVNY